MPILRDMAVDLSQLNPDFRASLQRLLDLAQAQGLELRVVQGFRTPDEQNALYAQGRTSPGEVVTNARGGQSNHNYGLSVDVVPVSLINTPNWSPESPLWGQVGQLAQQVGLEWGGNWNNPDRPHIQMAGADTLRRQQAAAGGGIPTSQTPSYGSGASMTAPQSVPPPPPRYTPSPAGVQAPIYGQASQMTGPPLLQPQPFSPTKLPDLRPWSPETAPPTVQRAPVKSIEDIAAQYPPAPRMTGPTGIPFSSQGAANDFWDSYWRHFQDVNQFYRDTGVVPGPPTSPNRLPPVLRRY